MTLKEKILQASDYGKDIIAKLYPESIECFGTNKKFRIREEKTASTSLKLVESKNGITYWAVNDWGSGNAKGLNAIDLYAQYYNITFPHACQLLANELGIDTSLKKEVNAPTIEQRVRRTNETPGLFTYLTKEFTEEELFIFGPFVTKKVLERFGWMSLRYYNIIKEDKVTEIHSNENYPIFARDCGDFYKIYKPYEFEKQYRFVYMSKVKDNTIRSKDFINGLVEIDRVLEEMKEEDKLSSIFICSGERDAMNVAGMGYHPVWFNSETTTVTYEQYALLKSKAQTIYNIPDIDETGIRQGDKLALQYMDIYTVELPQWLKERKDNRGRPRKDLRDFVELQPRSDAKRDFDHLVAASLSACFWEVVRIGKREVTNIRVTSLLYFLRLAGFRRWQDPYSQRWYYVQVKGYKVVKKELNDIRDFIRYEIKRRHLPTEVMESFILSNKTTKGVLDNLDSITLDFVQTEAGKVLHFRNGDFCVDKSSFTKLTSPQSYYWDNKVIPHYITRIPACYACEDGKIRFLEHPSKVYRFLINASRIHWREEYEEKATGDTIDDGVYREKYKFSLYGDRLTPEQQEEQVQHLLNKMYVYGYLLYCKKTDSHTFAVWAMENKDTDVNYCSGGSGKTLFYRCLEKTGFLKILTLDGRNPMLFNNNHYMERVDYDTDIIHFEDTGADFKFQAIYGIIDSGVTVNRKNEGSFTIPYQAAPNLVMCSNFAPPDNNPSTRRRIIPVIFSDYYHYKVDSTYAETKRVKDDFGMDLFSQQYSEDDYNADCNFMIDCLQLFMTMNAEGKICEPPLVNFEKRIHHQLLGDNMLEFFDDYFIYQGNSDRMVLKTDAYAALRRWMDNKGAIPSIMGFKKAMIEYCKYRNYIFNPNELRSPNDTRILLYRKRDGRKITLEYVYVHIPGNPMNTEEP
ncbi:MAG: toprim domain-containing protein [Paludibacteraceae bacterium]|nr:toprim domain-containing protein [Paludibacteraceae bacterium]